MTKHISDQDRVQGSGRLREFVRTEREAGPHAAVEKLRARPQTRGAENRKLSEFTRIARGQVT